MEQSKFSYYLDFVVYASCVVALAVWAGWHNDWQGRAQWLLSLLLGAGVWTLLEYLLHRFAFHHLPLISGLHGQHHQRPRALIGTPTLLSLTVLLLVFFLPLWHWTSINVASGTLTGIMSGFFWYSMVHHVIHHRRPKLLVSRLAAAARHHFRHHYYDQCGNFGVTTPFWDDVFGTRVVSAATRKPGRVPTENTPAA